jgi:hypothetical protein
VRCLPLNSDVSSPGWQMRKFTVGLVFAIMAARALAGTATFSNGASVEVPPAYASNTEEDGKTLVIFPRVHPQFEFRLTFHSVVPYLRGRPNAARDFVLKHASEAKADLVYIGSRNWVGYTQDLGRHIEHDGVETSSLSTIFAIREGVVVTTFTGAAKHLNDEDFQRFLHADMEKILASIKYAGS